MGDVSRYLDDIEALCAKIRREIAVRDEPVLFDQPASRQRVSQEIERQWEDMRRGADAVLGLSWRAELGPARRLLISRVLRDYPSPHTLLQVFRGFVRISSEWSPEIRRRCSNPEYILRANRVELHLEHGRDEGVKKPAPAPPPVLAERRSDLAKLREDAEALRSGGSFGSVGVA